MRTINCPHCRKLIETTGVQEDIRRFHEKFNISYDGPPRDLPKDVLEFRIKFLQEELKEYIEAKTLVKKYDALLDLLYVVHGTLLLHGLPANEGWAAVQAANMSKVQSKGTTDRCQVPGFDIVKPEGWVGPEAELERIIRRLSK